MQVGVHVGARLCEVCTWGPTFDIYGQGFIQDFKFGEEV